MRLAAVLCAFFVASCARGAEPPGLPALVTPSGILLNPSPIFTATLAEPSDKPYPISLPVALQLAGARPLDVAFAARQVDLAARQYQRARTLWLPNIVVGADYFRHEGGQQNFAGEIIRSSRGTVAVGVGPNLVFSSSDAVYAPLAARQDFFARTAFRQAAANDTLVIVAEAYFALQQSRVELAGATYALEQAEEITRKVVALAEGLVPPLEGTRAKVELARRKQAVSLARERWRVASAELTRLLRLPGGVLVEPIEPPTMTVSLITNTESLDQLIPFALTHRPELAAHQSLVKATLARLKQEKVRPLLPSLALRSTATNPSGSIAYGGFGGGPNDRVANFGSRFDIDVQLLWEFSALGLGNKIRVGERKVEHQLATLDLFRTQDRIAAEVTTAHAQLQAAQERLAEAEPALREAMDLVAKSVEGMSQTRRMGDYIVPIIRPQEVVAALQTLATTNAEYAATLGDFNRAQFRISRALGRCGEIPTILAPPTVSTK